MNEAEKDYRSTLNLPRTEFAMKANLPQREPTILQSWQEMDLYAKLREQRKGRAQWVLHDGPPYANGRLHIGHAVNKILKDMIVKSFSLSGYDAPYVPGWDCHGLPIEVNVEKKLGRPKNAEEGRAFRRACRDYAARWLDVQRAEFKRMGVLGDWENPYITMEAKVEANIIRALAKVYAKGHIQAGHKPVQWCLECSSALAEAEIEYATKTSTAIDLGFPLPKEEEAKLAKTLGDLGDKETPLLFVIWTTTAWTIPANRAVTVNPRTDYAILQAEQKGKTIRLVIAAEIEKRLVSKYELKRVKRIAVIQGERLEGLRLRHPFYDRDSLVTLGTYVDIETGTGLVHSAPAYGLDDFNLGKRYDLLLDNPVNDLGYYAEDYPTVGGWHIFKDEEKILDLLAKSGCLLHRSAYQHQYPHCWRHKKPTIYRATDQWFVSMSKAGLINKVLQQTPLVKWVPDWGQERIEGMMRSRPDWCISRQRHWGVPIPFFVHRQSGQLHPDTARLLEDLAKRMETAGLEAWYDLQPAEFLGDQADDYIKSHHILDVWFDSGTTHYSVLRQLPALKYPADLYLEGSDQHRGWFQSSILAGVAMDDRSPFKGVLTHGFAVDGEGRKMSKSIGNIVEPQKVINKLGADVLRLWVAATDYTNELAISDTILGATSDMYRRLRNTMRFLLANLHDFDPERHGLAPAKMLSLDRWILDRTFYLQEELKQDYLSYQYLAACHKLHNFCVSELGSFYLDIIKDRQYTAAATSPMRRSAQTAIMHVLEAMVRWLAPILSFTAEEIWRHMPGKRAPSVMLSEWYEGLTPMTDAEKPTRDQWQTILEVKECTNKLIEDQRGAKQLGSALEAEMRLFCGGAIYDALRCLDDELRFILITSAAEIKPLDAAPADAIATSMPELKLRLRVSSHPKCARCWHRVECGQDREHPRLCARCVANAYGQGETRKHG